MKGEMSYPQRVFYGVATIVVALGELIRMPAGLIALAWPVAVPLIVWIAFPELGWRGAFLGVVAWSALRESISLACEASFERFLARKCRQALASCEGEFSNAHKSKSASAQS